MDTAVFDTLAAIALAAVALIGAYAPVMLQKWGQKAGAPAGRSLTYILGNMLSAGVMVSAGFVHLLGQALAELNPTAHFPLAPFLCGCGFILTLVADHIAEGLSQDTEWSVSHCHGGGGESHSHTATRLPSANSLDREGTLLQRVVVGEPPTDDQRKASPRPDEKTSAFERMKQTLELDGSLQNGSGGSGESPRRRGAWSSEGADIESDKEPFLAANGRLPENGSSGPVLQRSISVNSSGRAVEATALATMIRVPQLKQVSFVTAVLMAAALCFHSILEGMAMGAQSTIMDTLHIFIAIIAHKGLAAYALGSSVVDSGATPRNYWTVIAAFALATPVGISLGRVVASFSSSSAAASLSALASGTFLYVAFMEVIPRELETKDHGALKLTMLCAGFAAMSLLAVWA